MNVVTGAFGYTGRYITSRLLSGGEAVRVLTGDPARSNPFGDRVSVAPFDFDDPDRLVESLRGAAVLYNTYWVRFSYGGVTFEKAVENSKTLIRAAEEAGVRRIVHVSITNASEKSPLPYFRGKGELERTIAESGLTYAIIRPTVIFGPEDILINNIAWLLRRFPLFVVPGSGEYRLQPVSVEDVADIAVEAGRRQGNVIVDAVGPEVYSFDELVALIADTVGSRARIVHLHPELALWLSMAIGYLVSDIMLTREEITGLMAGLLVSDHRPTGRRRFSEWLTEHAHSIGTAYASELRRHYRRSVPVRA